MKLFESQSHGTYLRNQKGGNFTELKNDRPVPCLFSAVELTGDLFAVSTQLFPEEHGDVESPRALSKMFSGKVHLNIRFLLKIVFYLITT